MAAIFVTTTFAVFFALTFVAWKRYLLAAEKLRQADTCPYSLTDVFGDRHLVNVHQEGVRWLREVFRPLRREVPGSPGLADSPHLSLLILGLAIDYDGTIAHHGLVDRATIESLTRFKGTGRRLILVTGHELPDLCRVFPNVGLFDRVVAENVALDVQTSSDRPNVLRSKGRFCSGQLALASSHTSSCYRVAF